jgi:hypothetical protein
MADQSIHDAKYLDELKMYTLDLFRFLDQNQYLKEGAIDAIIEKININRCEYIEKRGRVSSRCRCVTASRLDTFCDKHSTRGMELEYFRHNGSEFYLFADDNSVYTYAPEPIKIGIFDDLTNAIIAI